MQKGPSFSSHNTHWNSITFNGNFGFYRKLQIRSAILFGSSSFHFSVLAIQIKCLMKAKLYDVEPISSQNNNNTETLKIFMGENIKKMFAKKKKTWKGSMKVLCFSISMKGLHWK